MGSTDSRITTLVERRSRYVMLVRLGAKTSDDVVARLAHQVKKLPQQLKASLTWDRGSELRSHAKFTMATDVKVYFCDPHKPLAARQQREHERSSAAVLSQGLGSFARHAGAAQRRCTRSQHEAKENAWLQNAIGYIRRSVALTG
jgi:hypothetical protein